MAERPEDLNLPKAVVTRIIKDALPPGVNVGKDAGLAISKAASVFVLYATSCANNNALKSKRKTITLNDVYSALEDMEFEEFVEPLQAQLAAHKTAQASKKSKKAASKLTKTVEKLTESDVQVESVPDERGEAAVEEPGDTEQMDTNS